LRQLGFLPRRREDAEQGLVTAAQRGDRRAFDTLVQSHQTLLRGFLTRRVGPEAIDDVLQETWLACWAALPGFKGQSRFKAWLFSIAQHKVQDHFRASGKNATETLDENISSEDVGQRDPYAAVDLRHSVLSMLSRLPDAQREVLEMYYYAELTLPEIAQALGRNQNTVKYQFYRAHELVADGLGPLHTA
jgi:RNA polymerase sigma-70 factor (ECF subfamily)